MIFKQTLSNFDPKKFLKLYWQKKPLLIKQGYPAFRNPLPAKKLLAIAGNPTAEARVILEKGGERAWELRHGPFTKNTFKRLPSSHWTLLVQGTNHWNKALQLLLEDFYFIPQWRIEDIMTSFAVRGGNVGAHLDNYDVFLLQAEGRREWRIGTKPILEDDFLPDYEVKLLKHFAPTKTFILEPGDILYLPPRIAHHGIALDDNCITHSVGFRAPALPEILDDYLTHLMCAIDPNLRYADPELMLSKESGLINPKALNKIIQLIQKNINNPAQIKRWFGQFVTQNKYSQLLQAGEEITLSELKERINTGEQLLKNAASRFSYIKEAKKIFLYANGEEYILPLSMLPIVQLITAKTAVWQKELPKMLSYKKFLELLVELVCAGHFYFSDV